jgi:hypothetical protein
MERIKEKKNKCFVKKIKRKKFEGSTQKQTKSLVCVSLKKKLRKKKGKE